jgi:hypothetical protein
MEEDIMFFYDYEEDKYQSSWDDEAGYASASGGWGPHTEEILTVLLEEQERQQYEGWF